MKETVGDEKLIIIISVAVRGIGLNDKNQRTNPQKLP